MKTKRNVTFNSVILLGIFIIFIISCKKDNNQLNVPQEPALTTNAVTNITKTTAQCGGNITEDFGSSVTARGICWSTSPNPSTDNNKTVNGTGTGSYTGNLTGLITNTTYYVRAYATNSIGTGYGSTLTFTTLSDITFNPNLNYNTVSDIKGNIYKTIAIGSQVWMAENLKTTKYNDGTPILNVTDGDEWENNTTGAYAWYNNDTTKKATYGALYNWYAVITGKLCPSGWHAPTDAEFTTLVTYLGGETNAGTPLKETGSVHWSSAYGTNTSGFTALPGGYRADLYGEFSYIRDEGYWWASDPSADEYGWYRNISHDYSGVGRYNGDKGDGYAVRCVKN